MPDKEIPYEEAATYMTNLSGWVSANGRFFGEEEHFARYDGCTHKKCDIEGCTNRISKYSWGYCEECMEKREEERWQNTPKKPWDESTPVYSNDNYYWNIEDLEEHADYVESDYHNWHIYHCEIETPPEFDMQDFLCDVLAEDQEIDCNDINKIVNDWLEDHKDEIAWFPTKVGVSWDKNTTEENNND